MADIPANTSTTASITVNGGAYVDQLEVTGDRDWVRVSLTAGQTYQFALDGSGGSPVGDPYLRLYDSYGNLVTVDDDGGPGVNSLLSFIATESGTYYLAAGGFDDAYTGGYSLSAVTTATLPVYTNDQIANYLTDGFWAEFGGARHAFATSTITYNIQGLTAEGQALAVAALQTWSAVTGLTFSLTTGAAQITFDDNQSGAFANYSASGNTTTSANVNVSTQWLVDNGTAINGYSFQTYIHEIGHALGLGHAGNYNGSAGYNPTGGGDNDYVNDSWQPTVMSYFSQDENTYVNASYAYVVGPMMADIIAIQNLYGVPTTTNAGATTYGFNSTAVGYFSFADFSQNSMVAFTIYDSGGTDTLDASGFTAEQRIDLRAGAFSNIGGENGNIGIAVNAAIENAIGGSGTDAIYGNESANLLNGRAGVDSLVGFTGNDTYVVDVAADRVFEAAGGGTADRINAGASYTIYAGQQVEILGTTSAAGTVAINLTGNEFAQTLYGNAGANVIKGAGGADLAYGYGGNDTYIVDNINDKVFEAAGGGTADRVNTSTTYALAVNQQVEILGTTSAAGTNPINLTGNEFVQTIYGNAGANYLNGLGGPDTLYGFGGNDFFSFTTPRGTDNIDRIADFSAADDTIRLAKAIFSVLNVGTLAATAYKDIGDPGATVDASDRILYNDDNGALYYDTNGSDAGGRLHFATLVNAPQTLTSADFVVVA